MGSPTSRTLDLLRREGFSAAVVEKWIPQARQRKDVFGFGDILAIRRNDVHPNDENDAYAGTWLVQCTSGSNHSSRVAKIISIPEARIWLLIGNRISVVSWSKRGGRWQPRWQEILLQDLDLQTRPDQREPSEDEL